MGKLPSIEETPKIGDFVRPNQDTPTNSDVQKSVVDLPLDPVETTFDIQDAVEDFINDFVEGFKETLDNIAEFFGFGDDSPATSDTSSDTLKVNDTREFGLQECADAAKELFTPEVLSAWGLMDTAQRQEKLNEYAERVADILGVDVQVSFQAGLIESGCWGYNDGQGNVVLDDCFLDDPAQVLEAISTISHEIRHQFQHDVCENPENYEIDPYTVAEWQAGYKNYTQGQQTAEDPWGYFFNPIEIDARYFGESVVRELTRSFINE